MVHSESGLYSLASVPAHVLLVLQSGVSVFHEDGLGVQNIFFTVRRFFHSFTCIPNASSVSSLCGRATFLGLTPRSGWVGGDRVSNNDYEVQSWALKCCVHTSHQKPGTKTKIADEHGIPCVAAAIIILPGDMQARFFSHKQGCP